MLLQLLLLFRIIFSGKYKKRQKHPELKGKFGEDEDEDLLYRVRYI